MGVGVEIIIYLFIPQWADYKDPYNDSPCSKIKSPFICPTMGRIYCTVRSREVILDPAFISQLAWDQLNIPEEEGAADREVCLPPSPLHFHGI